VRNVAEVFDAAFNLRDFRHTSERVLDEQAVLESLMI
jgi:hypothetical protein